MAVDGAQVFSLLTILSLSSAVHVKHFYPFGLENGDQALPKADDLSSGNIRLRAPIAFYRQLHRRLYINLNGFISFEKDFPDYESNLRLPTGHRIGLVAPFLADVDTRGSGNVFYRETTDRKLLHKARRQIRSKFSSLSRFYPRALFIVTWHDVGYFPEKADKTNTFQLVIASDGRDKSVVIFNYAKIGWTRGSGKTAPRDNAVFAGIENGGLNTPFILPASGEDQFSKMTRWSNAQEPGVWMFQVGMLDELVSPDHPVDSQLLEVVAPAEGRTTKDICSKCHAQATCVEKRTGFCCQCKNGFFGNGQNCIESGVSVRINGRLSGELNGVPFSNLDTHAYVVSSTGRTFLAASRLPPSVGPSMRRLGILGRLIGWLFAVPRLGYKNGYMLTGGVFNHTAEVYFPSTGERATIEHRFKGHDDLNFIVMTSEIRGKIPVVQASDVVTYAGGSKVEEDYYESSPGVIKSTSSVRQLVNNVPSRVEYSQTITYNPCAASDETIKPTTLKTSRGYLRYSTDEQTVRFGMMTQLGPRLADKNPCSGSTMCSPNANCIAQGTSYVCRCKDGYSGNGNVCKDIDECRSRLLNDCDAENGQCFNLEGSFECRCKSGYRGDGRVCRAQLRCEDLRCDRNARCVYDDQSDGVKCVCLSGFTGDGKTCSPIDFSCNDVNNCDDNAACILDEQRSEFVCVCNEGFSGDGESCTDTGETQINCNKCDANAQCIYDVVNLIHRCQCKEGYSGDGYTCSELAGTTCETLRCDTNARCVYNEGRQAYECRCTRGFQGDGFTCEQRTCDNDRSICSSNGACLFDGSKYVCRCQRGFRGDGFRCEPYGCDEQNYCHRNGECVELIPGRHECRCKPGYRGDGIRCEASTCNIVNNCDSNADCISTPEGYKCRCRRNYQGDGFSCTPIAGPSCQTRPDLCDRNAACELQRNQYVCVCRSGYRGDGRYCSPSRAGESYLLFAQGGSVTRLPFSPTAGNQGGPIIMSPGETFVGLDVDCRKNYVFWSDVAQGTISRARLDGSEKQIIVKGLGSPEGLAVDWLSRNIYWTDSDTDTIEVAKVDGTNRKVLFKDDLSEPRAIVVHPSDGKIYWTDWDRKKPKIEVADTNGENRRVLISEALKLPNGLNLDYNRQELCWTDAGIHSIECADLQGNNRRTVYESAFYPFGITKSNDALYWTDWNIKSVQNINSNGGEPSTPLPFPPGGKGRPHAIKAVPIDCPRAVGTNACAYNNGGCKFLCLPDGHRGSMCACPDDVEEAACNEIVKV